jgi:actin-related protein 10
MNVSGKGEESSHILPGALKEEWIPVLEDLMGRIFLYYLNSNPKERRVIVCDAVDVTSSFRSALAFVLFNRFAVPAVNFVTSLTLPLYLTGLSTGVVIDMGYDATRVMATYAGVPIISAFATAAAAGRHINARLQSTVDGLPEAKEAKSKAEVEGIVEDIKARTCFVKCTFPGNITLDTSNDGEYQLGHKVVKIPAASRSRCMEVLFAGGSSGNEPGLPADVDSAESVPEAFCRMLQQCPVDVRPMVVQNIVISGGCAMVRGLIPRLAIELQEALLQNESLKALADRLQFAPVEFAPTFCIWMGGAVFGSLEGATDYTSEEYMSGKPIPDWASEGFV